MTAPVWLGLLSGVVFGFVIQRAGATNANEMARGHLMLDGRIPRFMVATVALASVGLLGLTTAGVGRTLVLPTSLVATGVGAAIFGVGWGLTGYCPGTCWAAAGEGRMDAIFALLGGFAGTAAFAHPHERLIPALYSPTNLGPLTLTDWLGNPVWATVLLMIVFAGVVWAIGRFWGDQDAAA